MSLYQPLSEATLSVLRELDDIESGRRGKRMRRVGDGALGWWRDHAIYPDDNPRFAYLAYWRVWSKEDQEDFGCPPVGYDTAAGIWLPEEQA